MNVQDEGTEAHSEFPGICFGIQVGVVDGLHVPTELKVKYESFC